MMLRLLQSSSSPDSTPTPPLLPVWQILPPHISQLSRPLLPFLTPTVPHPWWREWFPTSGWQKGPLYFWRGRARRLRTWQGLWLFKWNMANMRMWQKKKKKKRNHVVERVPERSEDSVAKVGAEKENSLKMDSCNQYLLNIVDVCGRFHRKWK